MYVARMREKNTYEVLVEKSEGKRTLTILFIDVRIILKQILNKECGRAWAGLICLRIGIIDEVL